MSFGSRPFSCLDFYRLQSRGGSGAIDIKASLGIGRITAFDWWTTPTEMMGVSRFSKIIRAAGRTTMDLDADDKVVVAAMVIPPEDPKSPTENGALLQ